MRVERKSRVTRWTNYLGVGEGQTNRSSARNGANIICGVPAVRLVASQGEKFAFNLAQINGRA